uniref:Uncharacterized protein n=1 Tax=viral metagenome TaxID=1070528 RepID=A0A6C0KTF3_9ZZZZ
MSKGVEKVPDKLTDSERKKIKQANKAKANPKLTAEKQKKKAEKGGNGEQSKTPLTKDE